MKVLTAMYTLRKGGSYDRFKMMLEAFLDRQCEVHCLSLTPIPIRHPFFQNHIMYFPFKKVDNSIARFFVFSIFPLWAVWIVWRNDINLIIAFGSLYAFIQGFAKLFLKRSMVTLIRGRSSFGLMVQNRSKWVLSLNRLIESMGFHFSDRIIANNVAAQVEILKRVGKNKNIDVKVLHNNIPPINIHGREDVHQTRNRYNIPGNAKVLVTAGVLNRGKNIEPLIRCLPRIEDKNAYVLIVGDGSTEADIRYRDHLKRLAEALSVSGRVLFTGWLEKEDLWKMYLAADLFVLSSNSEGMPNALLEALGLGLPCMGSDIPGIMDILQYEELLFDPQDEIDLANRIDRVLSDNQFFNKIKRLCQERKEAFNFDWKEKLFQMVTAEIGAQKA